MFRNEIMISFENIFITCQQNEAVKLPKQKSRRSADYDNRLNDTPT